MKKTEYLDTLRVELTQKTLSQSVLERIAYTVEAFDKDPKSVDVPTLVELRNDILADRAKIAEAGKPAEVVEASVIPAAKAKAKPAKKVADKPTTEPEAKAEPAVEKPKPKAKAKVKKPEAKPEAKGVVQTATESQATNILPFATMFPDTLTDANLGKLAKRSDIKTYADFKKAIDDGQEIIIAMFWTQRMLKKYQYGAQYKVPEVKLFPNDLDLVTPIMFLDKLNRVVTVSAYTDAIIPIEADDFAYIEDSNGKDKYQVRLSYSVEFELYATATK